MKHFYLIGALFTLFCAGCLDITIDVPVTEFKITKDEGEDQLRQALDNYLPTIRGIPCTSELLAFLLDTTLPIRSDISFPTKVRSDEVLRSEYAPKSICPDVNAGQFITRQLLSTQKIAKLFSIEPNSVGLTDCQKKFADPEKVRLKALTFESIGNTLNVDIPAGRLYYATKDLSADDFNQNDISALVSDGTLVQFATFASLPKGISDVFDIVIDEAEKENVTNKVLAQDIIIVIESDDFIFTEMNEDSHSYLELPTGDVELKISATVVVKVAASDLNCLSELP